MVVAEDGVQDAAAVAVRVYRRRVCRAQLNQVIVMIEPWLSNDFFYIDIFCIRYTSPVIETMKPKTNHECFSHFAFTLRMLRAACLYGTKYASLASSALLFPPGWSPSRMMRTMPLTMRTPCATM